MVKIELRKAHALAGDEEEEEEQDQEGNEEYDDEEEEELRRLEDGDPELDTVAPH